MKWRRGEEGRMEGIEGRPARMEVRRMDVLPFWLSCCDSALVIFAIVEGAVRKRRAKNLLRSSHPSSGVTRKKPLYQH